MAFFSPLPLSPTPSSPRARLGRDASIRSSVLKEIERKMEGKGGRGALRSPPLLDQEEKDARPEDVQPGYEFTDSVERGLLCARGCGGFRQKPHAYLSLSHTHSVLDFQRSLLPPARLRNGNCVCEERRGGAWPVLQSNDGSARNYYWANCILTNSKGVRV